MSAEAYPATPVAECHPDRLYVVGRLFGLAPPPVETCRVLEIGCSTGGHLLAAAATLPRAHFVGIDLSETQLARGRDLAKRAGITNVEFRHANLLDFQPKPAAYDYVTAHGVYSWVPPAVRDRLFTVMKTALAPHGVGYVSYNAYPGGHLREMFWRMLRTHAADTPDPAGKIAKVHELAEFLVAGQTEDGLVKQLFQKEADRLKSIPFPGMIHYDDLWEGNTPAYVTDVARQLAANGLRYVAEADVPKMHEGRFPGSVAEKLIELRKTDLVKKEQYIDFLTLRRYRLSVFAHAEATPATTPRAAAVPEFFVELTGKPRFDSPFEQAVIEELRERLPGRVKFDELLQLSTARAGFTKSQIPSGKFAEFLLSLYLRDFIQFHATPPEFATEPGERPTVSPLARALAEDGPWLSTLSMKVFDANGPGVREWIARLDGTRDRPTDEQGLAMLNRFTNAGLLVPLT
jgi:SAM-dependent methyltransferase